ncbi:FG-GAP repeat domain-containing protein [Streptomyces sp. NPDC019443]|uniref:FG-GAP repeat domain-containing protein n=1 Tax=Streptomyces sp. NPDC019443 TaxID=3365061 RepID=UPI00378CDAF9
MTRHAQLRRATVRRILGTALVPVLGLGIAATGAPAAFAAPASVAVTAVAALDPWSASVPLTDGTTIQSVIDLKTAKDGALVALWNRLPADRSKRELVVAVRPAGATVWGAPQVLATTPTERGDAQLVTSPDGAVTAAWLEHPNDVPPDSARPGGVFRMSVLAAGATAWSDPAEIAASENIRGARLAGSPSGRLVAVWREIITGQTDWGIHTSVRSAPGAAWSQPAPLDQAPGNSAYDPQLVYANDGTATVAFGMSVYGGFAVKAADLVANGEGWTKPVTIADPEHGGGSDRAQLRLGQDGRAVLVWTSSSSATVAQRPAGSLTWGASEPMTGVGLRDVPNVTVGPEGDITVLWPHYGELTGFQARTTTRSAATGTWSAVKTLSTAYGQDYLFDLTVGADGTPHAVWTQEYHGDTRRQELHTASRVNGVWTAPVKLSTQIEGNSLGQITVDAGNRPVAVWHQATGEPTSQVRAATTAPAPPAPLPKWRDFSGDGRGDLLALTSGGTLAVRTGTGTGGLATGVSATGWPSSSLVVPFGDLSGDKCNDLLVRSSSGALTRYDGSCGKAFSPSGPKLALGTGWSIYNTLTSPGDLTGDGRADLLARAPGGELYLYADSGAGKLKARVKIGTGWQIYNSVVGAGDLNGDTFGDLLARDSAGVLWRYNGTGKGTLSARVKVGSGWQIYNSVSGVGDITGDGKADLVSRDAAGVLWRYNGTGTGTFAARVKIGPGWQTYKALS